MSPFSASYFVYHHSLAYLNKLKEIILTAGQIAFAPNPPHINCHRKHRDFYISLHRMFLTVISGGVCASSKNIDFTKSAVIFRENIVIYTKHR